MIVQPHFIVGRNIAFVVLQRNPPFPTKVPAPTIRLNPSRNLDGGAGSCNHTLAWAAPPPRPRLELCRAARHLLLYAKHRSHYIAPPPTSQTQHPQTPTPPAQYASRLPHPLTQSPNHPVTQFPCHPAPRRAGFHTRRRSWNDAATYFCNPPHGRHRTCTSEYSLLPIQGKRRHNGRMTRYTTPRPP